MWDGKGELVRWEEMVGMRTVENRGSVTGRTCKRSHVHVLITV